MGSRAVVKAALLVAFALTTNFINTMFDDFMPFSIVGAALHFLAAIFFAIHAVRRGQNMYWLWILFMFPLLGSIVYFFAVYLPETRIEQGVNKMANAAMQVLDPGKALREAQRAYELTPTAQNRMQLAQCLLHADKPEEAAQHYEACLQGPFANDPEIRLGAAQAHLLSGQAQKALDLLQNIRQQSPQFQAENVTITLAKVYGSLQQTDNANALFVEAVQRFGSFEAHAEYAIWAAESGQTDLARAQKAELDNIKRHWKGNRHAKLLNKPLIKRLDAAMSKAGIR